MSMKTNDLDAIRVQGERNRDHITEASKIIATLTRHLQDKKCKHCMKVLSEAIE